MNNHDADHLEEADPQAWPVAAERLFLDKAANVLGGISVWTLRSQIAYRNVKLTHLGRPVFLDEEEVERIRRDRLPSLVRPDLGHPMLETGTENG